MKIALTCDPELPVPPGLYGGVERIVDMLAVGLADRGHSVTLFAHPDSRTAGTLVPWPGGSSASKADTIRNSATLWNAVRKGGFDIVHSNSRVAYLMPILPARIPKLMTYHRAISPRSVRLGHRLSRGTLHFTTISEWIMRDVRQIGDWTMVPNGVPLSSYAFQPAVPGDAPLVFLGRIEEIKGPHLAIELARRTGRSLIIAGNIPTEKQGWVDEHVLRHVDGDKVRYVGPVDDEQKSALLGKAAALMMPILWDEPFGMVMAEAMACGTPVVGMRRGAVPEIVDDGATGFVGDSVDELADAIARIDTIDRAACRRAVEARYSDSVVVDLYLETYQRIVAEHRRARA